MCLAARFALFTGDLALATRLSQKMLMATRGGLPSTPFELEASSVEQWAVSIDAQTALEIDGSTADLRRQIQCIESLVKGRMDQVDVDMLMLLGRCKQCVKLTNDALNIYNQVWISEFCKKQNNVIQSRLLFCLLV